MKAQRRKRKTGQEESVVIRELHAVEQRLTSRFEARIDSSTQSMKEYTDSRFSQMLLKFDGLEGRFNGLEGRMGGLEGRMEGLNGRIDKLDAKLDRSVNGLVDLIERGFGIHGTTETRLDDHERRLVVLESRER